MSHVQKRTTAGRRTFAHPWCRCGPWPTHQQTAKSLMNR